MKRICILAICLIIASLCFAYPSKMVPDWDKPITKKVFTDPELIYSSAWVQNPQGFRVDYVLDGYAERPMKLTMWVRTYARVMLTWQWVWFEYTVYIPANDGNGGGTYFYVNPAWQYQGSYNFNGDFIIDEDQYHVSYYGPQ